MPLTWAINTSTPLAVGSQLSSYKLIADNADAGYGNEEAVGKAIRESGIPRKDLFVTTKLQPKNAGRVAEAFQESLELLDIGYIDL